MTSLDPPRRVDVHAFGGPENLRVVRDGPGADLEPGEVRVRVLASSLTLSDSIVRRGMNPYTSTLPRPFTLGYDLVGVVADAGADGRLAAGDLVADLTRWGANADLVVRPAGSLTRLPPDLARLDPVLLEPLVMTGVTAYQSVHRAAGVASGQTVLVHGATGGVGLLLVELAALAGARVVATGSPAKHDALRARGATPLDGRAADLADRVRAAAPDGVDAVFDGVGGPSRAAVATALRPGGTFVGFGFAGPAGRVHALTPETLGHTAAVLAEGRAVLDRLAASGRTAVEYEVGTAREQDRAAYDADLITLARLVAAGELRPRVEPVPLAEV
ncbi:MAG TPA: zinc-binding dehydrogenase, partial [Pseudonocardia sp.]